MHAGDARVPVAQRRARAVAAAERRRHVAAERARLPDVFRRDPDVASIDHRRAVIAPARTVGIRVVVNLVTAEAIGGPQALRGDLHRSGPTGVDRRECGARVMVGPDKREGDHTLTAGRHGDRRVDHIVPLDHQVSLVDELGAVLL